MKKLLVFILIVFAITANAQDSGSMVAVTINPEAPLPGMPFNLTFVIDYPFADSVSVIAQPFSSSITVDRISKYPRTFETQTRTVVEYRLISNTSGRIFFNSFSIYTPQGVTETGTFTITIGASPGQQRIITPRLYWEGAPLVITTGERIVLTLRASNWAALQPPPAFFIPEVPAGVILSAQGLTATEREGGVVLKLLLIPLTQGEFVLPVRVLQYENTRFEIPALRIRIISR